MKTRRYPIARFALALFLFPVILVSLQIDHANALFPNVTGITYYKSGTHTILNITINHTPPPSLGPDHYVSIVELDMNGTIQDLSQPTPQATETFLVQQDIGEVAGTLLVRARAYCTVHGWSSWSDTTTVPEYSFLALLSILVITTTGAAMIKLAVDNQRKTRNPT
jgi:hypothetical protein